MRLDSTNGILAAIGSGDHGSSSWWECGGAPGTYAAPCDIESNYYCIKVLETSQNGHAARMLMLDRLIHSFIVPDDPCALDYGYERAYSNLTQAQAAGRGRLDTLFIGGGGYSFPRYVEAAYPASSVDVIEIDPAVIAIAHDRLGLARTSRIRSFNADARVFLSEWTDPNSTTSSTATRSTICRFPII